MSDHLQAYGGATVLVTGGAGAIGSNLARALSDLGAQVLVLDDLSSSERWNVPSRANVLFVDGSVLDEVALKRVFFERPVVVFHLASFFANQNSVDHPERDLMVNGMGTLRVLEYSLLAGVRRVVYASSGSSVYGKDAPLPLHEDFTSLRLATPYQVTKMLGEAYCNFFHDHHGIETVKLRFFNSYGPGEVPGQYRNVVPNFIYWASKGLPLPITGTGEETRDFTYVGDVVDATLRAGVLPAVPGEAINVASGEETRIIDLARIVNEMCGNEAGTRFTETRRWDTKSRRLASIERAATLLGYSPQTSLEDGLRHATKWFRENWDQIEAAARFTPGRSSAVRDFTMGEP